MHTVMQSLNFYTDHNVRRYGFHGTSHAYVSDRGSELAGNFQKGGWLTAHLGNGSSTCAVWNGQSVDTSMGLTPLEGVVMGTQWGCRSKLTQFPCKKSWLGLGENRQSLK